MWPDAHAADVKVQGQYGVDYKQYWVDEEKGKVFCLVDAPDRETATASIARRTASRPTPCTRWSKASSPTGIATLASPPDE